MTPKIRQGGPFVRERRSPPRRPMWRSASRRGSAGGPPAPRNARIATKDMPTSAEREAASRMKRSRPFTVDVAIAVEAGIPIGTAQAVAALRRPRRDRGRLQLLSREDSVCAARSTPEDEPGNYVTASICRWWRLRDAVRDRAAGTPHESRFPAVVGRKKPRGTANARICDKDMPASARSTPEAASKEMKRSRPFMSSIAPSLLRQDSP